MQALHFLQQPFSHPEKGDWLKGGWYKGCADVFQDPYGLREPVGTLGEDEGKLGTT